MNKLGFAKLGGYIIVVIAGTIVIHEAGHIIGALILGVPFSEIEFIRIGINPGVSIPDRFVNESLGIMNYAGGFLASVVMVLIYFLIWFRKYRRNPSIMTWGYGAFTMMAVGLQIGQGFVEGRYHIAYMSNASNILSIVSIVEYMFFALGMWFHFQLFPISRLKRAKE